MTCYHPTSFNLLPVFILNDFPLRTNSLLDTFIAFFHSQNTSLVCLLHPNSPSAPGGPGGLPLGTLPRVRGQVTLKRPCPAHCCSSRSFLRGLCDLWSLTGTGSVSHRVLPMCIHRPAPHLPQHLAHGRYVRKSEFVGSKEKKKKCTPCGDLVIWP